MSDFQKVVVVGGGVLGSQIAFQSAYCGLDSYILETEKSVDIAKNRIEALRFRYLEAIDFMKRGGPCIKGLTGLQKQKCTNEDLEEYKQRVEDACRNIKITCNYEEACRNADLVIEAVTENPKVKIAVYKKLANYLEEKTILATNSSTLVPSIFAKYTGRPEKYLALHFANEIWLSNTTEVMGHEGTDEKYIDKGVEFAERINMIPLRVLKECRGYILNSMLQPFLTSAAELWAKGIADPKVIDKTWKLATRSPKGPFEIIDIVGLKTVHSIKSISPKSKDPNSIDYKVIKKFEKMIDEGKLGVPSGEGFYKYNQKKIFIPIYFKV
ncbi:3-hydroxybutyryl-CoA dehydrogenase [Anaeromyces robustus]|uniref:3-hydroxybutyryl-CoA dehydrogenase n=1 Tax=Anaeromyces robustus TaxID=1754192 RepID=A0A1Y1XHY4_9FUNG|nr:3-hydroxybutyryl-CoA dehydrogenase [Anaeromyces robustus]|eukprot:ORX85312.1 3-hydroxybutyryl-CoA dehydrogenase [Anaeromyces robustus]